MTVREVDLRITTLDTIYVERREFVRGKVFFFFLFLPLHGADPPQRSITESSLAVGSYFIRQRKRRCLEALKAYIVRVVEKESDRGGKWRGERRSRSIFCDSKCGNDKSCI